MNKQTDIPGQNFSVHLPSKLLTFFPRGSLDIGLAITLRLYFAVGNMRSSSSIQSFSKASPTLVALNKPILNSVMICRNTSDSLNKWIC